MSFTPPPPPAYPPGSPGPGVPASRKRGIALVAGVILAGGAVFAITHFTGDDDADTSTAVANDGEVAPNPHQPCVDSWNQHNTNRASIGQMTTTAQTGSSGTAYVHVGANSTFPDRCMITVASASTLFAMQYLQDTGDSWGIAPMWTGSASQLDASVTDWNAKMDKDGTIILN
ncbi:hypothetical protein GCM10019016_060010 [Streptomyces prasinosporus]|uniref:Uncharacterized protein n=1 Tax=Streptomyces prasinosporus TaxID=68256 RepID=A0ABP6TWR1_9ACTN